MWIAPLEVIRSPTEYRPEQKLTYKELTYREDNEVKLKELKDISVDIWWWRYNQIKNLFNTDKRNFGFKKDNNILEELLLGEKEKLISKIYQTLLSWHTEDETVKVQMIRWAEDFKRNVFFESWEYLWKYT